MALRPWISDLELIEVVEINIITITIVIIMYEDIDLPSRA